MRLAKLFLNGNNTIEIHNSWLGKETIKYNGEIMSQKSSFWGATHDFVVRENEEELVDYSVSLKFNCMGGIAYDIYRNGEPIIVS